MEVSSLALPLLLIGVFTFGLTDGLKYLLPSLRDLWLGAAVRAVPVLTGAALGSIPGVFPASVTAGLCLLLGGAAGVFCAFAYEWVTSMLEKKRAGGDGGK